MAGPDGTAAEAGATGPVDLAEIVAAARKG